MISTSGCSRLPAGLAAASSMMPRLPGSSAPCDAFRSILSGLVRVLPVLVPAVAGCVSAGAAVAAGSPDGSFPAGLAPSGSRPCANHL